MRQGSWFLGGWDTARRAGGCLGRVAYLVREDPDGIATGAFISPNESSGGTKFFAIGNEDDRFSDSPPDGLLNSSRNGVVFFLVNNKLSELPPLGSRGFPRDSGESNSGIPASPLFPAFLISSLDRFRSSIVGIGRRFEDSFFSSVGLIRPFP